MLKTTQISYHLTRRRLVRAALLSLIASPFISPFANSEEKRYLSSEIVRAVGMQPKLKTPTVLNTQQLQDGSRPNSTGTLVRSANHTLQIPPTQSSPVLIHLKTQTESNQASSGTNVAEQQSLATIRFKQPSIVTSQGKTNRLPARAQAKPNSQPQTPVSSRPVTRLRLPVSAAPQRKPERVLITTKPVAKTATISFNNQNLKTTTTNDHLPVPSLASTNNASSVTGLVSDRTEPTSNQISKRSEALANSEVPKVAFSNPTKFEPAIKIKSIAQPIHVIENSTGSTASKAKTRARPRSNQNTTNSRAPEVFRITSTQEATSRKQEVVVHPTAAPPQRNNLAKENGTRIAALPNPEFASTPIPNELTTSSASPIQPLTITTDLLDTTPSPFVDTAPNKKISIGLSDKKERLPEQPQPESNSTVAYSALIKVPSRASQVVNMPGEIMEMSIEDESICRAIRISQKELSIIGGAEGKTTASIWLRHPINGNLTSVKLSVHVHKPWQATVTSDDRNVKQLYEMIKQIHPNCEIKISTQPNGSMVVQGTADSEQSAREVLNLIRKICLVPVTDNVVVRR